MDVRSDNCIFDINQLRREICMYLNPFYDNKKKIENRKQEIRFYERGQNKHVDKRRRLNAEIKKLHI